MFLFFLKCVDDDANDDDDSGNDDGDDDNLRKIMYIKLPEKKSPCITFELLGTPQSTNVYL